jgi:hypothetical protein
MAQNMDEIKKLGKEMDAMKTGSELQKGIAPDPIQSKMDTEERRKEGFWGIFCGKGKVLIQAQGNAG